MTIGSGVPSSLVLVLRHDEIDIAFAAPSTDNYWLLQRVKPLLHTLPANGAGDPRGPFWLFYETLNRLFADDRHLEELDGYAHL